MARTYVACSNPQLLEALDSLANVASDLRELLGPENKRGDTRDDDKLWHAETEGALAPEHATCLGARPPGLRGYRCSHHHEPASTALTKQGALEDILAAGTCARLGALAVGDM